MRRWVWLFLAFWAPVVMAGDHVHPSPVRPDQAAAQVEWHGEAILLRVEPVLGVLYVEHGEVPIAGWAPSNRDLRVRPPQLAAGLEPGMKIRFQLTQVDMLTWVITALEPIE